MDIQPVVTLSDVPNYIAKYAAKGGTWSEPFEQILQNILQSEVVNTDIVETAI